MGEPAGRSTAEVEDIETPGSPYVVLSAVQRGMLTPKRGRETIDAGWYVAPDLYTTLVRKLESFK